jgi:hypothetical protein
VIGLRDLSSIARPLGAAALVAAGIALGGCHTHPARPIDPRALAGVRSFQSFTIFWAGRRFEGFHLTAADRPRDYEPSLGMRVYYGDCIQPKGITSGGCTLPLEVNTVLYRPHSNDGLGDQRSETVRGVPAVVYDKGRSIELYTGCLVVDVFANNPARALRAAEALGPLNPVGPPAGHDLPPPLFPPGDSTFRGGPCAL